MKKTFFSTLMLMLALAPAVAQTSKSSEKQPSEKDVRLYGFIRTDLSAQARNTQAAVLDLFPLYTLPSVSNGAGEDLNAVPAAGLHSITTRIGVHFNTGGILGAQRSYGRIEGDFCGGTDCVFFRVRHAYAQLYWEHSNLLIGQSWHPLFTESVMPNVLSINTGAPFQPFSQSPQIRYTYQLSSSLNLLMAMVGQTAARSTGINGKSIEYQRNALIPDMFLSMEYKADAWVAGLGADCKALRPELYLTDLTGVKSYNKNLMWNTAATAYMGYDKDLFSFKAKAVYGQNLTEHNMIGGYAIVNTLDKDKRYVPFNTLSAFANVNYGKLHKVSLFLGYYNNLGSDGSLEGGPFEYYGSGYHNGLVIKNLLAQSLTYTYNPSNWSFGIELQHDNGTWGSIVPSENGAQAKIGNLNPAVNGWRVDMAVLYMF